MEEEMDENDDKMEISDDEHDFPPQATKKDRHGGGDLSPTFCGETFPFLSFMMYFCKVMDLMMTSPAMMGRKPKH